GKLLSNIFLIAKKMKSTLLISTLCQLIFSRREYSPYNVTYSILTEHKLSVAPEIDIMEYCRKEWRGNTPVAKRMRKVSVLFLLNFVGLFVFICVRVRGDNYCALRATLFQALSQATQLPSWKMTVPFQCLYYIAYPHPSPPSNPGTYLKTLSLVPVLLCMHILFLKAFMNILKATFNEIKGPIEKQEACDKLFKNEEEEYSLYEALKFLMLNTAIELYNDDKNGRRVPVFSWLLFARDTSSNPRQLMHNHLNHIGHSGGLEQVEMFLLAYALQYTIQVYRLYKYSTDEFITLYPNDPEEDWPVVTLITEDDRHYNIPVRMCQETML
uniref:OTU deubiquitinase with linear linkage specificity n=1 Tax=Strix occidentalis caurina TaxID=311401 RepID=A0A8D0FGT1_STROC